LQANWNNADEFKTRTSALDKNRAVYVYCLSGGRSSAAAIWLRQQGFTNVVELRGGFSSWKRADKPVEGMANIPQMTLAEYQQQITGKEYVLVDFGAEWCPPCRKMEPTINEFIANNKNVTLLKIDGGVHTDLMKQLNVEGIPTLLFLKNGTELWRKNGVVEKEELNNMFQSKK
jgi:thioredoxin